MGMRNHAIASSLLFLFGCGGEIAQDDRSSEPTSAPSTSTSPTPDAPSAAESTTPPPPPASTAPAPVDPSAGPGACAAIEFSYRIPGIGPGGTTRGKVTINGVEVDGVHVKKGENGVLKFHALDTRTTGAIVDFTVSAEVLAPANGLTVSTGPNPGAPTAPGLAPGTDLPFDLPVSAPAGAATGATAQLRVSCFETNKSGGLTASGAFLVIPLQIVD
jgi:hypothetical protein